VSRGPLVACVRRAAYRKLGKECLPPAHGLSGPTTSQLVAHLPKFRRDDRQSVLLIYVLITDWLRIFDPHWSDSIVPHGKTLVLGLLVPLAILLGGFQLRSLVIAQGPAEKSAIELLALPPRPERPALAPSRLPLEFLTGERIAFVGNSFAERMNLFGHFETFLHQRFPDKQLVVRNFGRPAEEVGRQQRSADYTALDDPLLAFGADTYFCFFGFNESFADEAGIEKFQADYHQYLDQMSRRYPRDDTGAAPRFVIISPLAFEDSGDPLLPDAEETNRRLRRYAEAVAEVARDRGLAYVDIFADSADLMQREVGLQLTINGCHLNEQGDLEVARLLDRALFGSDSRRELASRGELESVGGVGSTEFERLRAAVNDKSWVHFAGLPDAERLVRLWRTADMGHRDISSRVSENSQHGLEVRDRYIWDLVQGKPVPERPDDSETGELIVPPTRFGDAGRSIRRRTNCGT
jgi:lysophospholipase L1-like esterase